MFNLDSLTYRNNTLDKGFNFQIGYILKKNENEEFMCNKINAIAEIISNSSKFYIDFINIDEFNERLKFLLCRLELILFEIFELNELLCEFPLTKPIILLTYYISDNQIPKLEDQLEKIIFQLS